MNIVWKIKLKFILSLVLSLSFLFPYGCLAKEVPQQIVMSITQFRQLQTQTQLLDAKLQMALALLTEPQKQAIMQAQQLQEAQNQTQLSKQELQTAKTSLANASELISKQNRSLTTLSNQIKKERQVQRREVIQHTFWGVVGGATIGIIAYSIAK